MPPQFRVQTTLFCPLDGVQITILFPTSYHNYTVSVLATMFDYLANNSCPYVLITLFCHLSYSVFGLISLFFYPSYAIIFSYCQLVRLCQM